MLFSVAGAITLEVYTEGAVAVPLSLAGGYAGDNALRRFLETSKFWMDVSEPGALFPTGSQARATAMRVRVMHVAVRKRVGEHPEWDHQAWGLPISQTFEQMTQIGGAVAPALALWLVGYQTTPKEMRALIHFNRYMGYLLGVQPQFSTTTIREQLQALAMTTAARSYDSGESGKELIESFPRAFAPREGQKGLARLRAAYNFRIQRILCDLDGAGHPQDVQHAASLPMDPDPANAAAAGARHRTASSAAGAQATARAHHDPTPNELAHRPDGRPPRRVRRQQLATPLTPISVPAHGAID